MDPTDTNEISQEFSENTLGEELSHSDKMIGIFTEPTKTFEHTANFPPRNKDWVIPLVIFFFIIAVIRMVSMMNEEVFFEAKQKQIDAIEEMVESETLTREDGNTAIERIDEQMEFMQGPFGWIITIATTLIFGFIVFFIIVGIYFLFVKLLLKGEGSYASALVANGMTAYISIVQYIVVGILTMAFSTLINDTSLAALIGADRTTIAGFLLAKIDPLSLWAYIVLSIGLSKMFKSESTGKYYALVFSLWIVGGLLLFLVAQAVPFLSFLAQ
jgi:hypothetical protein